MITLSKRYYDSTYLLEIAQKSLHGKQSHVLSQDQLNYNLIMFHQDTSKTQGN